MTPIFLPGLCDLESAATVRCHGHFVESATERAERVFARLHDAPGAAAGAATGVCKLTMQIADRAYPVRMPSRRGWGVIAPPR
jgi:hypothetical protein